MLTISEATHRIRSVSTKQLFGWVDWDDSWANKDPTFFHNAPLTADQHAGTTAIASEIGHLFIMTASGQERVMDFLKQHGGLPKNVSLASDSGHNFCPEIANGCKEGEYLAIPGYDDESLKIVLAAINGIMTEIGKEFPIEQEMLVDRRRLCGALVHQFPGDGNSEKFTRFQRRIKELKDALPKDIGDRIKFDSKVTQVVHPDPDRGLETHGYVDLKPVGMSKGATIEMLFSMHPEWFPPAQATGEHGTVHFVVGDSGPDLEMMRAVVGRFGRDNVVNIAVGPSLKSLDTDNLIDLEFLSRGNNITAVQMTHKFLIDAIPLVNRPVVPFLAPSRNSGPSGAFSQRLPRPQKYGHGH